MKKQLDKREKTDRDDHFLCARTGPSGRRIFLSINTGSIKIGFGQMLKGLFVSYDKDVATVYDLRFPRVVIAMFAGRHWQSPVYCSRQL